MLKVSKGDPRLSAAELPEDDFTGELQLSGEADFDLWSFLTPDLIGTLKSLPIQPWVEPSQKEGYTLQFEPSVLGEPYAFVFFGSEVAGGMAFGDNVTVKKEHQSRGLGKELVLAGHVQSPSKPKPRLVSKEGEATIRKAFYLIRDVAAALREESLDS